MIGKFESALSRTEGISNTTHRQRKRSVFFKAAYISDQSSRQLLTSVLCLIPSCLHQRSVFSPAVYTSAQSSCLLLSTMLSLLASCLHQSSVLSPAVYIRA